MAAAGERCLGRGLALTTRRPQPPRVSEPVPPQVGLRLSLSKPMPFGDGAFDLLHSRMSGLRFVGAGLHIWSL